jgi:hypothetical protein
MSRNNTIQHWIEKKTRVKHKRKQLKRFMKDIWAKIEHAKTIRYERKEKRIQEGKQAVAKEYGTRTATFFEHCIRNLEKITSREALVTAEDKEGKKIAYWVKKVQNQVVFRSPRCQKSITIPCPSF